MDNIFSMPIIQTEDLTKIYRNGFHAVTKLSLRVEEGDIFGFLGPNGAGKTTTIRMLDGLLTATSGTALIAGKDIRENPEEIKRIIGVVPESHGYYFSMTPFEYLEYFASLFGTASSDSGYLDDLLEKVGLADKKNVPIGQFSRGMKQRLGIAKALVNRPRIIFLDEPTLGLDPKGQHEIQQMLLDINCREKITVFITSHLLKDIEVMCNKVCIIKNGCLLEQGSIPYLQEKYMKHYTMMLGTSDNGRALRILSNLPAVRSLSPCEDGRIEVKLLKTLTENEINRAKHEILTGLTSAGIDIEEMRRKTLSMEDIFFRATEAEAV